MPKELKKLITKMSMYLIHAYTYPHALPPHDPPPHIHTHILNYTYAYRHVCRLITPYISMSIHINVYVFIIGICIYLYRYIYTVYIHCVHLYRYVLILSFICFLFIFISFFVHSQSFRFSLLLYCRMHERHFACFFS